MQKSPALQFRISEKKILAQVGRQGKVPFKLLCANLDDNGMDMNRKANMTPGDSAEKTGVEDNDASLSPLSQQDPGSGRKTE